MTASVKEVCEVPGIGPAKAAKILAALDLGRRAAEEARPERDRMGSPRDVYERMRFTLRDLPYEEFHVLLLNTQNEILRDLQVTRGTLDASLVHPREVFKAAIAESAAAVVLVHNHPSGDPTPSAEDRAVTRQLREAGQTLGIDVLDHVIIGEGRYTSFVEKGIWDTL
jgi:DNA repair protein RadC